MPDRAPVATLSARPRALSGYLALSWAVLALQLCAFARGRMFGDPLAALFALAVCSTYALFYLAPLAVLAGPPWLLLRGRGPGARALAAGWAIAVGATLQLCLFMDRTLFQLYGFHLNGFVWNLVTTRGGIESMGSGNDTFAAVGAIAAGFVALQACLWWLGGRLALPPAVRSRRALVAVCAAALVLGLGERAGYAVAYAVHRNSVLEVADAIPLYLPTRARTVTRALGIAAPEDIVSLEASRAVIDYPLRPLERVPHKPLNVVWLVAESLRADALDPEVMPATSAFAARSLRFRQHYSGGNNTRMGMFSMFYGLYGGYWFAFQEQERDPVLMDTLIDDGYRIEARTSAKFTYPEFAETIFARVPHEQLFEGDGRPGWMNDRDNVEGLLQFIGKGDSKQPFFAFMFFESPHARYEFPPESVIRTPYLDRLNYATMNLSRDIELIRARYLNAVHHLDSQLARVFAHLEQNGLLDSTIVVVTGDHGEEFMEKGHWGHASGFSEEQTRVPLVLWIPGQAPAEIDRMTSHLDLPATVLGLLGVTNPPSDYSLGYDLLHGPARTSTVVSGWDDLAFVDAEHKMVLPVGRFDLTHKRRVTARNDSELAPDPALGQADHSRVLDLLRDLRRFGGTRSG
jgi:uncharacterized protein